MGSGIRKALMGWKERTNSLHFASDTVARWTSDHLRTVSVPHRVLDIGLGSGRDVLGIRRVCGPGVELHGIEGQAHWVKQARDNGIVTYARDIERESLPVDDEFFDVVLANHVIEHSKELFWLFGEISRVVRKGGMVIIGCPNLASWHNRAALLFGRQPPCMKLLGPHVRGITRSGFGQFIEYGGYFAVERSVGSNFYPLPTAANRAVAAVLPGLCASMHFLVRRTAKAGSFLSVLDSDLPGIRDTPYFRGGTAQGTADSSGSFVRVCGCDGAGSGSNAESAMPAPIRTMTPPSR